VIEQNDNIRTVVFMSLTLGVLIDLTLNMALTSYHEGNSSDDESSRKKVKYLPIGYVKLSLFILTTMFFGISVYYRLFDNWPLSILIEGVLLITFIISSFREYMRKLERVRQRADVNGEM